MICCLPPLYKNLKNLLLTKELQQQPWFFKQASKISTQPVGGFSSLRSYPPGLCITWRSVLFCSTRKAHQPQPNKKNDWCWSLKMKQTPDEKTCFCPRDIGPNVSTFPHGSKDPLLLESNSLPPRAELGLWTSHFQLPVVLTLGAESGWPLGIHVALHWRLEEGDAKEKNP